MIAIEEFAKEYQKVKTGEMRPFQLMKQLGMSKATFYRYVNKIGIMPNDRACEKISVN